MAATVDAVGDNPFKSIMNMLINNKCWLCKQVFQRGKVKKVFMVSHLLRFLDEKFKRDNGLVGTSSTGFSLGIADVAEGPAETASEPRGPLEREDVKEQSSLEQSSVTVNNAVIDDELHSPHLVACFEDYCRLEGDKEKVMRRLREIECDTWMSGLICGTTQACAREYLLLVPEGKLIIPKQDRTGTEAECPPGCDCDNPWQYISAILEG